MKSVPRSKDEQIVTLEVPRRDLKHLDEVASAHKLSKSFVRMLGSDTYLSASSAAVVLSFWKEHNPV